MNSCGNVGCGIIGDSYCDLVGRSEERSARVQVWVPNVHFAVIQHDLPLREDQGASSSKVVGLLITSYIRTDCPCAGRGNSGSTCGKICRLTARCQVLVDNLLREALPHPGTDRAQCSGGSRITNALHLKLDGWLSPGLVLCPCSLGSIWVCGNHAYHAFAQALGRLPGVGFLGLGYSCVEGDNRGRSRENSGPPRAADSVLSSSDDNELDA